MTIQGKQPPSSSSRELVQKDEEQGHDNPPILSSPLTSSSLSSTTNKNSVFGLSFIGTLVISCISCVVIAYFASSKSLAGAKPYEESSSHAFSSRHLQNMVQTKTNHGGNLLKREDDTSKSVFTKLCSRDKSIQINQFCINGETEFSLEDFGEHTLRLNGMNYWPSSGYERLREGECHDIPGPKWDVEAFTNLIVGTEEHDPFFFFKNRNDNTFAELSVSEWYSTSCDPYEVRVARDFENANRHKVCTDAMLANANNITSISESVSSCSDWTDPADSYIWYIRVEPQFIIDPSTTPSAAPSEKPSGTPSSKPSIIPSSKPSTMPSSKPSRSPSSKPSRMPSSLPTNMPSLKPSSKPSSMPTSMPSSKPSVMPSSTPSAMPTATPSSMPTSSPTSMSSSKPSSMSSSKPSSKLSYTSVALNKPTSQSSTYGDGVCSRAVDGDTNGNWKHGSVTHTKTSTNPYWQVDLQDMYAIDTIKVYNREDCCASRLADFTVTILREDIVEWSTLVTGNAPYLSTISVPSIIGSVVRISLSGENLVLSLAEVEVFGTVAPRSIIFRNAANNNLCLDVYRNQYFNGNKVWLYTCNNTAAQKWKVNSKGEITIGDNYEFCLSGGTGGLYTPSFIWKCNDVESHIWKELGSIGSTGRITSQKYNKSIGVGNGCGGVASQRIVELQGHMNSGMCRMQQEWKLEAW